MIELGGKGAAGNPVICEVLPAHINEGMLDGEERVDPFKLVATACATDVV